MGVEVANACRGQNVVPKIREQIGRQSIGAGGTSKGGPCGLLSNVADPIKCGEKQDGHTRPVEAPRGCCSDLGNT